MNVVNSAFVGVFLDSGLNGNKIQVDGFRQNAVVY